MTSSLLTASSFPTQIHGRGKCRDPQRHDPPRLPWRPCQPLTHRSGEHARGSVPSRTGSVDRWLDQKHSQACARLALPRKEVIQPQLPLRLPCYDFVPITSPALDGCLPEGLAHRLQALPAFVT